MDTFHICKTVRDIKVAESYEEKRDRQVAESMAHGGEFYPFAGRNFSEAIGEPDLTDAHFAIIGDFLSQGKDDAAIQYMRKVSVEYWLPRATSQAAVDLMAQEVAA